MLKTDSHFNYSMFYIENCSIIEEVLKKNYK